MNWIRIHIILFLLLAACVPLAAQHHANWYFGNGAGIGFSSGSPVALSNGMINTTEGCASISDLSGNLLFYTDGTQVYDRLHQVMPNGSGLMGHHSSSNSALIVPYPGRPDKYILFTADAGENQFYRGYRYSIVDMTLNGGNGDIILKNELISTGGTERMAVVKHGNGKDYWLVTKDRSGTSFRSFKVDCAGVHKTPVYSYTGVSLSPSPYPSPEGIGYLKASPNGSVIGMTVWDGNEKGAYVFHFDASTGMLSDPISLSPGDTLNTTYGIEFSPDNQYVYISHGLNNFIRQYRLSTWNPFFINASAYTIPVYKPYGLQLGPDNRIYIAKVFSSYLARINFPNNGGAASGFTDSVIHLQSGICYSGLPLFPNQYAPIFNSGADSDTTQLQGSIAATIDQCRAQLTANTNAIGNVLYYWDFGNGIRDTGKTVTHYFDPGAFTVSLSMHWLRPCKQDSLSVQQQITIVNPVNFQFAVNGQCAGESISFTNQSTASTGDVQSWTWSFGDGQTANGFHASHIYNSGSSFEVVLQAAFSSGCTFQHSESIQVFAAQAFAGNDTTVIQNSTILLQGSGGTQYLWTPATGLSNPAISNPQALIVKDIQYILEVTSPEGCTDQDTVLISTYPFADIYVPNAFTPNGDGKNDLLRPLGFGIREIIYFRVFNRWGQQVYFSKSMQGGWDGKINGETQGGDTFVWMVEARDVNGKLVRKRGSVVLIR